ncbi:uncharacterized protein LOC123537934 isoform X2 [Mercenaria mercenaria]|uniref:uncharacterized protein LOC123537934 isoform X2 n=1 Tax=Mercenaria mercenaria TaxID=6596 RepID=UPI00234EDF25|nr:uncharacterized protein LOC123537934 isoform X2 [Mercenaria mercenaria]
MASEYTRRSNCDLITVWLLGDEHNMEMLMRTLVPHFKPDPYFRSEYPPITETCLHLDVKRINLLIRIPMSTRQRLILDPVYAENYSHGEGVLIVCDATNINLSSKVQDFISTVECDAVSEVNIIIVGSICYLKSKRNVSSSEGKTIAERYGAMYLEVIATDYSCVRSMFDQAVRQMLHRKQKSEVFYRGTENDLISSNSSRKKESTTEPGFIRRLLNPIIDTFQEISEKFSVPGEMKLDPYILDLYEKALKDGIEQDRSVRVNIVGNYKQGKTSLTKRLLGQNVRGVKSTNGIEIEHYTCYKKDGGQFTYRKTEGEKSDIVKRLVSAALNKELKGEKHVEVQQPLQAVALQENSISDKQKRKQQPTRSIKTTYKPLGQSVYDTDQNRKQDCTGKLSDFGNASESNYRADDGNEKAKRVLTNKEIDSFSKALSKKTSKSPVNMPATFDIWDFGGQYIFYATHTIFHSRRAIYLLVFDLSLDLKTVVFDDEFPAESNNRNMEFFLQFWMQSIHSFVGSADGTQPKVILVGTHKDQVRGNADEKRRFIKNYFDDVRQLFDGTKMLMHLHPDDFPVDNTDPQDASVAALKETIGKIGNEETNILEIPAKWIQLEKSLKEKKHLKILSLDHVMAIDSENEFPLRSLEQAKLFLRYHHSKGTFVYFDEEPISQYVVLDPQYLIDAFKTLITSERFCLTDPEIRPIWKKLLTEARLEKKLIEWQWSQFENKANLFHQYRDILLAFLTKHHIISEAKQFDETTGTSSALGWYIVPSLLRDHSKKADIQEFLQGKKQSRIRLVMFFELSQIVPTIYHRYIAAVIAKWPIVHTGRQSLIFADICVVRLNANHAGVAEMKYSGIELTVVSLIPSLDVDGKQADIFKRFSEAVIIHEFRKLQDDTEHIQPYILQFRCNHESHGQNGSINTESVAQLDGNKLIACPDVSTHDLYAEEAKLEWFQDCKNLIFVPNTQLNDKLLSKLSHCIGENWQLLGYELGLTRVQIEHIVEDHPNSTLMKIYYMLKEWSHQIPNMATLDVLVQVMQSCPTLSIQWDGIRNIVDGIV